jgi:superfamily I DNA/RNA helicase
MYEDSEQLSSAIGAFKLQSADNIKAPVPQFYNDYKTFLKQTKSRDFSDMLIEVRDSLRDNKWLKLFKNQYDYIFIDEYQDTSTIQLQILLSLNAKYYYLIGDRNQSIYGYSGANCVKLEEMLKSRRDVKEMSLSINFRSDEAIVENSNKYSSLTAVSNSKEKGSVNKRVMLKLDELIELLKQPGEIVVLVRTNAVIRSLEKELLKRQVPMRYFNFITEDEIKAVKNGDVSAHLRGKLNNFKGYYDNDAQLIGFIERFKNSPKFVTTIHKSKGREFDECVVVNSISPEILKECNIFDKLGAKRLERISFTDKDEESRNIHYVAVSRSKHKVHFMIYE